jgi:hypothetical protein
MNDNEEPRAGHEPQPHASTRLDAAPRNPDHVDDWVSAYDRARGPGGSTFPTVLNYPPSVSAPKPGPTTQSVPRPGVGVAEGFYRDENAMPRHAPITMPGGRDPLAASPDPTSLAANFYMTKYADRRFAAREKIRKALDNG